MASSDPAEPQLTEENCSEYFMRFRPTTRQEAIPFGPWLHENVGETMCVYYSDYGWGQVGTKDYGGEFESAGGEVIEEVPVPVGTSDHSEYISQIDTDADILFSIIGGSDAVSFVQQATDFGILNEMDVGVPGGDFFGGNLGATSGLRDGFYSVWQYMERAEGPWNKPHQQEFIDEFEKRTDSEPSAKGGMTYDMITKILSTAESVGFQGREDTDALIDELRGREFSADEYLASNAYLREDNHQMLFDQVILESDGDAFEEHETFSYEQAMDTPTECEF